MAMHRKIEAHIEHGGIEAHIRFIYLWEMLKWFKTVIFTLLLQIDFLSIFCWIGLRWVSQNPIGD